MADRVLRDRPYLLLDSLERCGAIEPMSYKVGVLVLCDRKPRHSGKHLHRGEKGRVEWWKAHTDTHAAALVGRSDG